MKKKKTMRNSLSAALCAAFNFQLLPAAAAATSVTQRCYGCCSCKSLSQGSASSVLWPTECKNFHATDTDADTQRYHYNLQPIVAHTHTNTPPPWRQRHACVSFSVKLPVVSLCVSLPLPQLTTTTKRKAKQSTVENEVGKLHGTLHATPARIGCSLHTSPSSLASPRRTEFLPAIQSSAHAPTRHTHTQSRTHTCSWPVDLC